MKGLSMKKPKVVPMINFPVNAKLKSVNQTDRKFRLGKIVFHFPFYTDCLKDHKFFLDNFAVLEISDDLPVEFNEDVTVRYFDGNSSNYFHTDSTVCKMSDGNILLGDFIGLKLYNKVGLLLEVGIESTDSTDVLEYVFRFHENKLTSNKVTSTDLIESVVANNSFYL